MKIFEVKIDNDPGGWKSGHDPTELVIAETPEEAIQKVKDGWGRAYSGDYKTILFGNIENIHISFISKDSHISAREVAFHGYDIKIEDRESKIDEILSE